MKRVKMQVRQSGSRFGMLSVNGRGNDFRKDLTEAGFKEHENVLIVSEEELEKLIDERDLYKRHYETTNDRGS